MQRREVYKNKLVKHLQERREEAAAVAAAAVEADEPDFDPTEELTVDEVTDEEQDETWGFLEPVPEQPPESWDEEVESEELHDGVLEAFFEEGYEAFLQGVPFEANPIADIAEAESDEEKDVLSTVWEDGWSSARKEQLIADVILAAREVIQSEDEEIVSGMFQFLTERIVDLDAVLDLAEYEKFWWPQEEE